jgi:hypothetical protein
VGHCGLVLFAASSALAADPALPGQAAFSVPLVVRVVDARSGAPLTGARVSIRGGSECVADVAGRCTLAALARGEVEVGAALAGYGPGRALVRAGEAAGEVELRLDPQDVRRAEQVAVVERPVVPGAPAARLLEAADMEGLAGVLVDDPLRSVQSMPGVAAADDFGATFAARGQGFASIGFYVDGVLMAAPFHTIRDVNDGFSLTVLDGEVVESVSFVASASPARYGDRTGGVVDATIREGSRDRLAGSASLGVTGMSATLGGPAGRARNTSWLVSARKSYLGYVLRRLEEDAMALDFYDGLAKLSHHPDPAHTFSLTLLHGRSRWTQAGGDLRPQDTETADAGTDLATLRWLWLPSARMRAEAALFFARETGRDRNFDGVERLRSADGQWGARAEITRVLGAHQVQAGAVARGLSEELLARAFQRTPGEYVVAFDRTARTDEHSGYLEESWTPGPRLRISAGARADRLARTRETRLTPRLALEGRPWPSTRIMAAFGQYAHFPRLQDLFGRGGSPDLRAERATHALVGVEHDLGGGASVRVEAYDQRLDGLISNPEADWRLAGGRIVGADSDAPLRNGVSGRSRGAEITLQRRSPAGLSGWAAYTLGRARWREDGGVWFDGDFDQRHTVTVFALLRAGRTFELGSKFRYGSGFPVPGYYERAAGGVFLSSERNRYRPEPYSRWDVRAGKAFVFDRWKLRLQAEVVNVLGRTQTRYRGMNTLDVRTGRVAFETDALLPRMPSLGVAVEF